MSATLPFTNRMRELRSEAGISQADLAKAIGMTRQTINAVEKGKYSPSLEAAFSIADVLGVRIEEVFLFEYTP